MKGLKSFFVVGFGMTSCRPLKEKPLRNLAFLFLNFVSFTGEYPYENDVASRSFEKKGPKK